MYRLEEKPGEGTVVTWMDQGHNCDPNLYVESMFYQTHKELPDWATIQADSGVYGTSRLKLFDMR